MTKTSLSVIIVSYNVKDLLHGCLGSIINHQSSTINYEVIVVDNASTDGSVEFIKELTSSRVKERKNSLINNSLMKNKSIKLIENRENLGFGKANNLGAKKAKGEFVLFLNPDTKVCPGSLKKMVEFFKTRPRVGIIGPQLLNADGSFQPSVGRYPSILSLILEKPIDFLERRISITRPFLGKFLIKYKKFEEPSRVDWVSGAALACRKEVWESLKGFDENFFMYFEDTDFCLRARKTNWEVYYLPGSKIYHLRGKSQPAKSRKKARIYYQSQDYYFQKNKGQLYSWLVKFVRWPYQFLDLRTRVGRYY